VIIFDIEDLPMEQQPKMKYYKFLADLFNKYDIRELEPASSSTSGYCLTNRQDLYLYYLPADNNAIHVTLPGMENSIFKMNWFNPLIWRIERI
jgi:hypothetical protein